LSLSEPWKVPTAVRTPLRMTTSCMGFSPRLVGMERLGRSRFVAPSCRARGPFHKMADPPRGRLRLRRARARAHGPRAREAAARRPPGTRP
jgi:hypothetical protein